MRFDRLAGACAALLAACSDPKPPPPREKPAAARGGNAQAQLPPGHPPVDLTDPKKLLEQVDALGEEMKKRPKSFEVLAALGNLYYDNGRYLEAIDSYREALEMAAPAREKLAAAKKALGKGKPEECALQGEESYAALVAKAEGAKPAVAAGCLARALSPTGALRARRGNSFYLIGNADAAVAEHKKALEEDPTNGESLFFLGAIVMERSGGDKKKIAEGKTYWEKLLQVAPDHPRAELVRQTLPRAEQMFSQVEPRPGRLPPGHPPIPERMPPGHPPVSEEQVAAPSAGAAAAPLNEGAAAAVAAVEKGPELEAGLRAQLDEGEAALDRGAYQDALIAFRNVMPLTGQYPALAPRAAAGMGAALRGLGRPNAEAVLQQAVRMDPKSGRALYELGALYAASGRQEEARQTWTRLLEADPAFAARVGVEKKLAELK